MSQMCSRNLFSLSVLILYFTSELWAFKIDKDEKKLEKYSSLNCDFDHDLTILIFKIFRETFFSTRKKIKFKKNPRIIKFI